MEGVTRRRCVTVGSVPAGGACGVRRKGDGRGGGGRAAACSAGGVAARGARAAGTFRTCRWSRMRARVRFYDDLVKDKKRRVPSSRPGEAARPARALRSRGPCVRGRPRVRAPPKSSRGRRGRCPSVSSRGSARGPSTAGPGEGGEHAGEGVDVAVFVEGARARSAIATAIGWRLATSCADRRAVPGRPRRLWCGCVPSRRGQGR
jgi:hypothetical protein